MTKSLEIPSDISDKDYRSLPIESYSSLKYLLKSPKDFLYYKSNPFKGSNSTLLGTAIHHYLQGNRHLVAFSVIDKRKKEAYAEFEANFRALAGEEGIIVPASFEKTLDAIMKSANESKTIQKLLSNIQVEVPYYCEYKGLKYKAKIDGIGEDYVLEIKSSSQATTAAEFREEAIERHYDLQAAMYIHTSGRPFHYFIVINTMAPFKVAVYKTSDEMLISGFKKLDKIVQNYDYFIVKGNSYDDDEVEEI